MSGRQTVLPFKLESTADRHITAYGGLPVLIEALRAVTPTAFYRRLRDALGSRSWRAVRRHVESLVCLIASGGECIDDLRRLRADHGLGVLLGDTLSSPTQVKEFLYAFHQAKDGRRLTEEDDRRLSVVGTATIRDEGPALRSLAELGSEVVRRRQASHPQHRATLDVDATIIEAHKARALKAYEGTVGYQPQMAWWAEQAMWVQDEFRDGNVPAAFQIQPFLEKAFAALPGSVTQRRLRADSALYDEKGLSWADEQGIEFAVSAEMTETLRGHVARIAEDQWAPYVRDGSVAEADDGEERQWAVVVDFIPNWKRNKKKNGTPFTYIAVRVRSRQTDLLVDEADSWRHFALVTNMDWPGERLLRWHREKQGTVEHGHRAVKNDLAGRTLPCGRFGANAAWWRMNVLVHNLLQFLKAEALPAAMATCRPKALRFRLFNIAGTLARSGRRLVLKLAASDAEIGLLAAARAALFALSRTLAIAPS